MASGPHDVIPLCSVTLPCPSCCVHRRPAPTPRPATPSPNSAHRPFVCPATSALPASLPRRGAFGQEAWLCDDPEPSPTQPCPPASYSCPVMHHAPCTNCCPAAPTSLLALALPTLARLFLYCSLLTTLAPLLFACAACALCNSHPTAPHYSHRTTSTLCSPCHSPALCDVCLLVFTLRNLQLVQLRTYSVPSAIHPAFLTLRSAHL